MNLRVARERGIDPLSFSDISQQLGEGWNIWVLFDTVLRAFRGNYWRVLEIDRKQEEVELQFCGRFGISDYKGIEPFRLSVHEPFFTGVTVQKFVDDKSGEPVSLTEFHVRKGGREPMDVLQELKCSEEIYWSQGAGPYFGLLNFKYIEPQRGRIPSSG